MTLRNDAIPGSVDHAADHNQIVAAIQELDSRVDAVGVLADYEADAAAAAAAAAVSRDAAAASAVTASSAAGTATTQAGNASTSAGTATSQASAAGVSAAAALASQNAAASSAGTATTQAGIATTQAGLATTERVNAGLSAASAESDADDAAASAAAALASQNAAAVSQSSASTSSSTATTKAAEASASAAAALLSEGSAAASDISASDSAAAALASEVAAEAAEVSALAFTANGFAEVMAGGSPVDADYGRMKEAEALLSRAVWWVDAKEQSSTGAALKNLGWGGPGLDAAQGTAGNQPEKLDWDGTNYAYLPGVASNYLSTPDAAALDITGDIDIRVKVALDDWTPASIAALVTKFLTTGNQRSWEFRVQTGGTLELVYSADGVSVVTATSTAATGISDGAVKWCRATLDVDNGASGRDVKFWLSDDGSTWTQLGSTVTVAGTTSVYASTQQVEIGSSMGGGTRNASGKFYRAIIKSGIDGTTVLDIDTSLITSGSDATFTARTGQTVTINTSTAGRKSTAVTQPTLLFGGSDDYLEVPYSSLLDFAATDSFSVLVSHRMKATPLSNGRLIAKTNTTAATDGFWLRTSSTTFNHYLGLTDTGAGVSNSIDVGAGAGVLDVVTGVVNRATQFAQTFSNGVGGTALSISAIGAMAFAGPMRIGIRTDGLSSPADMEFFGAAVFRFALTNAQIALITWYYQQRDKTVKTPVERYATAAALPATPTAGDLAYVNDVQKLVVAGPSNVWRDVRQVVNLLNADQSSNEAGPMFAGAGTNCTFAQSSAQARSGTYSTALTVTATGVAVSAYTSSTSAGYVPVSQGRPYTAHMSVRPPSTGSYAIRVYWYKANFTASATTYTTTGALSGTAATWRDDKYTVIPPTDAAYARPVLYIYSSAAVAGEVWYADQGGVWEAAGGLWVNAGERVAVPYLGYKWDETAGRRLDAWDTVNSRFQNVYYDSGRRVVTADAAIFTPAAAITDADLGLMISRNKGDLLVEWVNTNASTPQTISGLTQYTSYLLGVLPVGFRPTFGTTTTARYGTAIAVTATGELVSLLANENGDLYIQCVSGTSFSFPVGGSLSWRLPAYGTLPTTLPGTASGSIPS